MFVSRKALWNWPKLYPAIVKQVPVTRPHPSRTCSLVGGESPDGLQPPSTSLGPINAATAPPIAGKVPRVTLPVYPVASRAPLTRSGGTHRPRARADRSAPICGRAPAVTPPGQAALFAIQFREGP